MSALTTRRLVTVAALALLTLLGVAAPAGAHAELTGSTPSNGTVLRAEPDRISLRYSEEVTLRLASIRVIGPDGHELAAGAPQHPTGRDADTAMTIPLRRDTALGTYTVVWHAVAADDGHATSGVVTFAVGHRSALPSGLAAAIPGRSGHTTQTLLNIMIWLGFAGFALLAGQLAVRVAARTADTHPTIPSWPASVGWLVLLVATLGQLLCYGPYAAGVGWSRLFDRSLIGDTLHTQTGHALMIRAVLLVLLAVAGEGLLTWITVSRTRWLPIVICSGVVLCLAATWADISHAASGSLVPLALPATTLHVAAMGVWAGGLATLTPMLRRTAAPVRPHSTTTLHPRAGTPAGPKTSLAETQATEPLPLSPTAATVHGFSALAFGSVCVLAVTGVFQAWRELGGIDALTDTHFGRLLLVKSGVVALVLLAASRSRAAVRRRSPTDLTVLRRSVLIELVGVTVLLVVVTLLIGSPPPHR